MQPGKWAEGWKVTKKDFESSTKKKKPKATVEEKASKKSGLGELLRECDKLYISTEQLSMGGKKSEAVVPFSGFKKNVELFEKTGTAYTMDIQRAMVAAKDTSLMNELDVLRKQITAISASMKAQIKGLEASIKDLAVIDAMAKNLSVSLEGACKRAYLFLAKVKAKPETWNDAPELMKAARDVYQQAANIEVLKKKGKRIPGIPATDPPSNCLDPMKVWRTGKPQLTGAPLILAERERFLKAVQGVEQWLKSGKG